MMYAESMPIEISGDRLPANARLMADQWPAVIDVDHALGDVRLTYAEMQEPVVRFLPHGGLKFTIADGEATYRRLEQIPVGTAYRTRYRLVECSGRAGGDVRR